MSTYTLTTRNDEVTVEVQDTTYTITIDGQTYTSTLANVGPQGAAGKSVVSGTVNGSGELVFTMSDSSEINLGNVLTLYGLKPLASSADLGDVESGTLSTGVIQGGSF